MVSRPPLMRLTSSAKRRTVSWKIGKFGGQVVTRRQLNRLFWARATGIPVPASRAPAPRPASSLLLFMADSLQKERRPVNAAQPGSGGHHAGCVLVAEPGQGQIEPVFDLALVLQIVHRLESLGAPGADEFGGEVDIGDVD